MTLTEFLLERIEEDEAAVVGGGAQSGWEAWWSSDYDVMSMDEGRFRAECEAKRRIIDIHAGDQRVRDALAERGYFEHFADCLVCEDGEGRERGEIDHKPLPCSTLRALGLAYADHADYRDEWRPA